MKILLIDLWESNIPSLGLGYLAAYARKYGGYTDITIVENEKKAEAVINNNKPDIVGFKTVTPNYNKSLKFANKIKEKYSDIKILVGGPHVTSMPNRLDNVFDIGVIGEGEETFLELLNLYKTEKGFDIKKLANIKGIAYHYKEKINITEKRKPIENLDLIPFPAIDLFDKNKYFKPAEILVTHKKYIGTSIMTSRGCPYQCIYCQASSQWGRFRMHSPEYVVEEIKQLHDNYQVTGIVIVDDLFIANKERVKKIVELLEKEGLLGKIEYMVSGRANLIDEEILGILKKMGVIQVALGFETGSDRLLRYLKKNSVTLEQNINASKLIKKYGMHVYGLFMMGSPTETKEEMYQTIDFFKSLDIDTASISITSPLPGTEMWHELYAKGKINYDADWDTFLNPVYDPEKQIYINENVPKDEFIKIYKEFQSIMILRGLQDTGDLSFWDLIIKAIKYPKLAIRVGTYAILKNKLSIFFNGRKK